jgi:gliding motility-associated-like protein
VNLTGNVTNNVAATYLWTSSPEVSISNPESLNATSQPTQETPYTYTFTATTANNCSSSASVVITINNNQSPCGNIKIPNAFTPNGDGFFDVWKFGLNNCFEKAQVDVYNRWGGLVYHADNYNNDWDGTYQGKPLPDATYYYIISIQYTNGITNLLKGNVTIIR